MLMPKKDRVAIYEYLFKEGVMVAKQDFHAPKHPSLDKVPNLHVIKALQSLKSRGYVKEQFAWRHYYWYLTNEGIQYLRDYLHLPSEIVPATLKRQTKPEAPRGERRPMKDGESQRRDFSGRDNYRRDDYGGRDRDGGGRDGGQMPFRGGFGRGRGGFDRGPPREPRGAPAQE